MKKQINVLQAVYVLPMEETIHTFRNSSGVLLGCDWSRTDIIKAIKKHSETLEVGGPMCRKLKHALVLDDGSKLFIETDEGRINEIDPLNIEQ